MPPRRRWRPLCSLLVVLVLVIGAPGRAADGPPSGAGERVRGAVALLLAGGPDGADPRVDEVAGLLADELARFPVRLVLLGEPAGAARPAAAAHLCSRGARAVIWFDLRRTEARLVVRVCRSGESLERWAPYQPEDPDRAVTLAHLMAALLRAGISSGPPVLDPDEQIEPPPEAPPAPAAELAPAETPPRRVRRADPAATRAPADAPAPAEESGPVAPIAPARVELGAHISVAGLSTGPVLVGGGVGVAVRLLEELLLRLDVLVYQSTHKEKSSYFIDVRRVPFIFGLCYQLSYDRYQGRICAEGTVDLTPVSSGPTDSGVGPRKYELEANPGVGGSLGFRIYALPNIFVDLAISSRYYITSQKYTIEGDTALEGPRHDLESRVGLGISF